MNSRFVGTLLLIIIIACFATGVIVYPNLPTLFASHWNAVGQPNGAMNKFWGISVMPFIMLLLVGLWALLPRIDPIAPGFKGFRYVYDFFFFVIIAFLAYVYALTLWANLGWHFNMLSATFPALALLIFIIGALMPRLKRNWFVGIRTPWTISNDTVWDKTHKLSGTLFEISALFILASAFVSREAVLWLVIMPLIAAALISAMYSYVIFKNGQS